MNNKQKILYCNIGHMEIIMGLTTKILSRPVVGHIMEIILDMKLIILLYIKLIMESFVMDMLDLKVGQ